MNAEENDYTSDSEEEDDDYCPEKDVVENASEEDSDGEAEDALEKTKIVSGKRGRENTEKADEPTEIVDDDEAEKKRAESLWADFLSDSGSAQSSKNEKQAPQSTIVPARKKEATLEPSPKVPKLDLNAIMADKTETLEKKEDKTAVPQKPVTAKKFPAGFAMRKPSGGGMSSVLNQIGKKSKVNTLEKTKLDWDTFKQNEGITEDLQTFNKGRDGYLERQDFLQRTDVRQFEIERGLRQTKRTNR